MTRTIAIFLFLVYLTSAAHGQVIDSIEAMINAVAAPKAKIEILTEVIWDLEDTGLSATHKYYAGELIEYSKKEKDTVGIADGFESLAKRCYAESSLDSAIMYFDSAYTYFLAIDQWNSAYVNRSKIGVSLTKMGRFEEAEEVYRPALQATDHDSLLHAHAQLNLNMGSLFFYQRVLDSAEVYYERCLAINESLGDTISMLSPMNNLAGINYMRGNINVALDYLHQIKNVREKQGDQQSLAITYITLGTTYLQQAELDSALKYSIATYDVSEEHNLTELKTKSFIQIAEIYNKNEDYESALNFANRALKNGSDQDFETTNYALLRKGISLSKLDRHQEAVKTLRKVYDRLDTRSDIAEIKIETELQLATAYLKHNTIQQAKAIISKYGRGEALPLKFKADYNILRAEIAWAEGNADEAISFGTFPYDETTSDIDLWSKHTLSGILAQAYEKKGDFRRALDYAQQHAAMGDSLNDVDRIRAITIQTKDFEFQLEKQQLEAQQQLEEAELKAKNSRTMAWAISLGAIGLLSLISLLITRRKNNIIQDQKEELSRLMNTKDQIFAIIGHDLRKPAIAFNGLSRKINYLLKKNDFDGLSKLGDQIEMNGYALQKLIDNVLQWALVQRSVLPHRPESVNISQLTSELSEVLKGRVEEKRIEIENQISDDHHVLSDKNALYTALFNLMDNAIKYTPEGGRVSLNSEIVEDQVKISVQDNGSGMPPDQLHGIFLLKKNKSTKGTDGESGTGLGLHIAHELIKLNNGLIKVKSTIGEGSVFDIVLPY